MAAQPAPGELEVVREFVNTWDEEDREESLGSPDALAGWLREHGLLDAGAHATPADVRHARDLREALRALLRANHGDPLDTDAVATVDAAARRARLEVRFDPTGAASTAPGAGGVDGALGAILARVAEAQRDGTWPRLKVCSADTCQWAFYDTSRNRSGVWCDMAVCGNRQKVKAYRRRASQA
jgi:predicted RNA-binding Zn ribbon-like protein